MSAAPSSFERFEIKYWASSLLAERIARFARPYLAKDPFSRNGGDARNVSLYLDTPAYAFHAMHTSGALARVKLRVRVYGDLPPPRCAYTSPREAFFEVKRKVKNITLKDRATLTTGDVPLVLAGSIDLARCSGNERRHLETFLFLRSLHRAEPKVLVSSRREAFVSRVSAHGVRLTIDRQIMYQPAIGPVLAAEPGRWRRLHAGAGRDALIEIKFRGPAPTWVAEMVSRFELRQRGFSKYIAAVDHLRGEGEHDERAD